MRQIADHSTFLAPYNAFVYLCSGVANRPMLDVAEFPAAMFALFAPRSHSLCPRTAELVAQAKARSRRTCYVLSYTAKLAPIAALAWLGLRAVAR